MMNERRSHERVAMDRAVLVQLSNGKTIQAKMVNLSLSGLCLEYPAPAEPGATLGLHFLLTNERRETVSIHCKGIARHSHVHHENFITGFEFTELKPEDKIVIGKFIKQKLSKVSQSVIVR